MGTDTSSTLDQPTVTGTTPKPPRDKVMRSTMTTQLLDEVRAHPCAVSHGQHDLRPLHMTRRHRRRARPGLQRLAVGGTDLQRR